MPRNSCAAPVPIFRAWKASSPKASMPTCSGGCVTRSISTARVTSRRSSWRRRPANPRAPRITWSISARNSPERMTQKEAETRHAELADEIRRHDHAYYVLAQPSISDQDYDRLYHELLDIETKFPALVTPDSPSQRVSGEPLKEFKPV